MKRAAACRSLAATALKCKYKDIFICEVAGPAFRSEPARLSAPARGEAHAALAAGQRRDETQPVLDGDEPVDVAIGLRRLLGQQFRLGADRLAGGVVAVDIGERRREAVVMQLRLTAMDRLELPHQH